MKKLSLYLTLFTMFFAFGNAQQQTTDGGYLTGGSTSSYTIGYTGLPDMIVYKLDGAGNVEWFNNYGGVMMDYGSAFIQTADGGYIAAGASDSFSFPDIRALAYKLDPNGNVVWRHVSDSGYLDYALDAEPTSDGGCILAGTILDDPLPNFLLQKIDADGGLQWTKSLGGWMEDLGYSVQQTADGGYIVAGVSWTYTHGSSDFLVYKVDANGAKRWRKNYGGIHLDRATSIKQTADGGYVVAGQTQSYSNGGVDGLVYKLNAAGAKQWRKNYGGSHFDWGWYVHPMPDGGYILGGCGMSYSNGGCDFLVYKLDARGQKQWRKNYGGIYCEHGGMIQPTTDGGFVLFGESQSYTQGPGDYNDLIIYKLDADGQKQWRKNYGGPDWEEFIRLYDHP